MLFLVMLVALSIGANAQAPQGIPYQAVARNSSGVILASTTISVRFTIRDSVATGTIKYRETFSVTTTAQGMFSVNVGQGTPVTGTFSGINWGTNAKFMQVEIDPAGGLSYIDMGTTQMMSVPYSIYSSNGFPVGSTGDLMYHNGTNWVKLPAGTAGQVLTMGSGGTPVWGGCTLPSAGTITGTGTVTVGSTITLSNAIIGGAWSSGAAAIATVGSTGVVTGVAAGTATISYTVTNSCGSAVSTQVVTVNAATLSVGSSYGGGVIAYILVSGDPGYVAGEVHGLIAASSDQSTGIQWGCFGTLIGGTSLTLGSGATNTGTISSACGAGTASRLCADIIIGGYSDWYLPSFDELNKLWINRSSIGGFTTGGYWSSSEYGASFAWGVNFATGATTGTANKFNTYYVRAVRSF